LGGSLIVFSEGAHFTARERLSHQGATGGRFVNRWSVSDIEIGQKRTLFPATSSRDAPAR
jgi:hypothetical protein